MQGYHLHHKIGFDSTAKVDWHLRNLFEGAWATVTQHMPADEHRRIHSRKERP